MLYMYVVVLIGENAYVVVLLYGYDAHCQNIDTKRDFFYIVFPGGYVLTSVMNSEITPY